MKFDGHFGTFLDFNPMVNIVASEQHTCSICFSSGNKVSCAFLQIGF